MLHLPILTDVQADVSGKQLCIGQHRTEGPWQGSSGNGDSARSHCLHPSEGMKVSSWPLRKQGLSTQPELVLLLPEKHN